MLIHRDPARVFGFFGWLFAGLLNPASVMVFAVTAKDSGVMGALVYTFFATGLPSAMGIGFVLLRLRRGVVSMGRLFGLVFRTALGVAAVYPLLFVLAFKLAGYGQTIAAGGTIEMPDANGIGEILATLVFLPFLGVLFSLLLSAPAALSGSVILRLICFKKPG